VPERTLMIGLGLPALFLQNYTVKWLDNTYINSQGPSEQESVERISKPIKEHFLNMGRGLSGRTHFDDWARFACTFLQNYTVK